LSIGVPATVEFSNPEELVTGAPPISLSWLHCLVLFVSFFFFFFFIAAASHSTSTHIPADRVSTGTKIVAETVQNFITAMDSLKLHMVAVDQLQPLLHDLMDSLNKVSSLPPEWEGKTKLKNWCELLLAAELKDFASLTFSG
jgi:hypothetical protein